VPTAGEGTPVGGKGRGGSPARLGTPSRSAVAALARFDAQREPGKNGRHEQAQAGMDSRLRDDGLAGGSLGVRERR
jgi:hypothetical protein